MVFDVQVKSDQGIATDVQIERRPDRQSWAEAIHGHYLLRTDYDEPDPAALWSTYMQLTQAEATFRITKSDPGLRPVKDRPELCLRFVGRPEPALQILIEWLRLPLPYRSMRIEM